MKTTSTPAVLVMTAMVVGGGLLFLIWVRDGEFPTNLLWPAAIVCVASLLVLMLVRVIRNALRGSAPAARPRAAFASHTPERMRAVLEAYNRSPAPDIPELVDYLIHQAATLNSSDIHLVPYRDFMLARYRVDGMLTDVAQLAAHLKEPVTNRLKILSQLITYVHDKPQDGRIDWSAGDKKIDLRIAFMPTLHGERVVMRLLDRAEVDLGLGTLGLSDSQLSVLSGIVARPQGMVILTGPTGAGKTTTIYCALRTILNHSQNTCSIYTLEDPIEYDLLNINQTQIEEGQGFTFEKGLRSMLRQDPNVIMVGEIRDLATARIAIQAGMTGHLIITTVHAKSATGVFSRLIEMGVDPHSVSASVTAVVAQRLARILCAECKRVERPTPGQEAKLGRRLPENVAFYGPVGCAKCGGKGYAGRQGIFEILEVNEVIRQLIVARASSERIHREFLAGGLRTLEDNGLELAMHGDTSLDELLRVMPLRSDFE